MFKLWLSDYVTKNSIKKNEPSIGSVTACDAKTVAVDASQEFRDMPIVAPFGIAYNPPKDEQSVVLPIGNGCVCIGVVTQSKELNPGELMLFSSGGASIVLKNNGDVVINGKVFDGEWT